MKPGERLHPRPVMNDAQRRIHHGRLHPMQQPSLLERLIDWLRR